jgi:hypothetical protein
MNKQRESKKSTTGDQINTLIAEERKKTFLEIQRRIVLFIANIKITEMKKLNLLTKIETCFLLLFILSGTDFAFGQEENLNVMDNWIEWTDGKNMLIHHLNSQAFDLLDKRDKEIAGLKTKKDWITRQKKVKDILMNIVGPFPEKTPLNAKVTGIVQKEGYRR